MQGKQKTESDLRAAAGCLPENRVEPEATAGAQSIEVRETGNGDSAIELEVRGRKPERSLLEAILNVSNMFDAQERVIANRGFEPAVRAGIDGMTVDELHKYFAVHKRELCESIRGGWYKPKPVKRVEIPKPDGGKRLLGVPTVIDRMVQQAMVQVLQPVFEQTFSDGSFGFRPGRSAQQAIERARKYYEEGYIYVVDLDLEKYFDSVNHDLMIKMVRETIKDEAVIAMIRKFLKSGVMVDGLVSQTEQGTPQGGPLSPLLSNIYLTKFDRMLEERGHKFVRYADDCNIYVKSPRAALRVMEGSIQFLEGKLKLKVNRKKSTTGSPTKLKFLGFSLYQWKEKIIAQVRKAEYKTFFKIYFVHLTGVIVNQFNYLNKSTDKFNMAYSIDFIERAVAFKHNGHTFNQLREVFGIPAETFYLWEKRLESGFYEVKKPKQERNRKINKEQLKKAVTENPDAFLYELAALFDCSPQAIFSMLQKLNSKLKKRPLPTVKNQRKNVLNLVKT
jgi:group II intron reverse transcriptase/maturase